MGLEAGTGGAGGTRRGSDSAGRGWRQGER